MSHKKMIINTLHELGQFLGQFTSTPPKMSKHVLKNDLFFEGFKHQLKLAQEQNGWFTSFNLEHVLNQWHQILSKEALAQWLSPYNIPHKAPKTIALVMAGNIPMVGFHDLLSVLVSGHRAVIKLSSNDKHLIPFLTKYLTHLDPNLKDKFLYTNEKLDQYDAVIATGSNNTARYFEAYFKNKPSIIRKNRNSVAVLTGKETPEQLQGLGEDIFRYYGLGCRNITKIFVPKEYDFDRFFKAMYSWHPIMNSAKYANNYDYNKAVYLMSEFELLENGFLMLKEDSSYSSPIATLFYQYYNTLENLHEQLKSDEEKIQCVVAHGLFPNEVEFGQTQCPSLTDYADGIDTVDFLLTI